MAILPVLQLRRSHLSFGVVLTMAAIATSAAEPVAASVYSIGFPAYDQINRLVSQNQSQFFVFADMDSPFNHGFPSGLFGTAQSKLHFTPNCVYSAGAANGCSTDPTALDRTRGTVFQLTFDPLAPGEYVGVNFEEPENWGANPRGRGYDLTGATNLVFDAISPTGGLQVQFSVNGGSAGYTAITNQWQTFTIPLAALGPTPMTNVHLLFGIATSNTYAPNGGTVLLDNIHFTPVPASQTSALGLPLANAVFGILHVNNTLPGAIPIPPDQINANLATLYESSLAALALINADNWYQNRVNGKLIADTLVNALGNDNQGDPLPKSAGAAALHNGMSAGDVGLLNSQGPTGGQQGQTRLAGFTAPGACPLTGYCLLLDGATGGNNAFAILALAAAYKEFGNTVYLNAALTIGNWIYNNLGDNSGAGYGGYFAGYPDQGLAKVLQTGKSTENNADIFAAFTAIATAESAAGNPSAAALWTSRANIAGDFVMQMFDPATGHFFAGTVQSTQPGPGIYPTGASKGRDIINTFDFLDAQTFPTLAMAAAPRYHYQIDWRRPVQWVVDHFQSAVTASGTTFQGFDLIRADERQPSDGPAGIAWEFTAQTVKAMGLVGSLYNDSRYGGTLPFRTPASTYYAQILQAWTSAPFADGLGMVAATMQNGDAVPPYSQCLVTPFQCIAERDGLAATIWAMSTETNFNPFQPVPAPLLSAPPPPVAAQAVSLPASAGGGSLQVGVPDGAIWTAASNTSWITITSGATGTGGGTVTFTVSANTGAARSGTITVAGQTITIQQEAASVGNLSMAGSIAQIVSGGGWDTSLTLVNLGVLPCETLLNFPGDDGSASWLPFTFPQQSGAGATLGATFDQRLAAGATLVLDTTGPDWQATATGFAQLLSNGDIGAFANFTYTPTGQAAASPLETRNASSYLLPFDNTGQVSTGLAVANLASSAANINVVIRDDSGAQVGAGAVNLAAQGHNSFMLTDATYGFPSTAGIRGTVEFDTPTGGRISVLGLRANTLPSDRGFAITSLPVMANVGTGGGVFAHIASGNGWQTTLTLVNTGPGDATFNLSFYDENGGALALPLSFPQSGTLNTASSVSQSIPAGGSLIIVAQDPGGAASMIGSAALATAGSISGFAVFRYNPTGQEAAVSLQPVNSPSYVLAFDNTGNLSTALAIANAASQPASVNVILRNDAGAQIGGGLINLSARGHTSFMLTDTRSGGWAVAAGVRGTIEFDTPPGGQIAPIGLRAASIPGGFTVTTIPVMEP